MSPEDVPSKPPISHRAPWASLLLFLSGLLLWGPIALSAYVLSSARFSSSGMAGLAAVVLVENLSRFVMGSMLFGIVLLAIYGVIQRPWKKGRRSVLFVLQLIWLVVFLLQAGGTGISLTEPVTVAMRRAAAGWQSWNDPLPRFRQALGEPPDGNRSLHRSDLEEARKLFESSEALRNRLQDNGHLLCEFAAYIDPQGLEFLLAQVWPGPQPPCSLKNAAERAIKQHNYDSAVWLMDRVEPAQLPQLAVRLLQRAQNDTSVNIDANQVDYDALALPVLERMFECGLRADSRPENVSLLTRAVRGDEAKMTAALIAHGADPNEVGDGTPLLHEAIVRGGLPLIQGFLAAPGLRLDVSGDLGWSTLKVAISSSDAATVAALLSSGAPLPTNSIDLIWAKDAQIMQLLLDHGMNPRARDADGNTLLAYMYQKPNFSKLAAVLVKAGLPLNARNRHGATILNYLENDDALSIGAREALIELGAQLGKQDRRLVVTYAGGPHPVVGRDYTIRLQDGREIKGKTDIFGKTDWVPDGKPYELWMENSNKL